MTALNGLNALLIEPHAGMRASLHNMLNLCGVTRIEHAVSSGSAIKPLKSRACDLVICEYDLGEGQDGQQLLEDLRHNNLIPLSTIFIIVTAERSYEKVVSAAELAPTDYILKPFTADMLLDRINRAVEKRTVFLPIHQLMEHGSLHEAIDACKDGESEHPRYIVDFMRLRAELHVSLGEPAAAESIYQQLLATKAIAWARLGLAKTLFMQQHFSEAEELLTALVAENSKYMDAYDWLARTHESIGRLPAAKDVLADAVSVSPHAVRRLRKLGEVALEIGDMDTAEQSFQKVVLKARYSEFRDPEDHVRLVQTLIRKGDGQQAATVIRDLGRSLAGLGKTPVCRAISTALLHTHNGDTERAAEELGAAVVACRDTIGLSNGMKMTLAASCLQNNLEEGASEVMLDVMSNTADGTALAKAMSVFEQAGRKDLAESVARESRRQVMELVTTGAEKAKLGDYRGAVDLMTAAVHKMPDNPQVVFNAAVAVLKYLENLGWESKLGEQVRRHIETARRLDPTNPRLASLTDLHQNIVKKYGIKMTAGF
jgi:DNA-binding NarL/FixJ family response regulator/Tfp pilus assembly protein PilF